MKNITLAIFIALAYQQFAYGSNPEIDSTLKNAETYNKQKQYQKAIAEYDKAFSLDPALFDSYAVRANAYMLLKQYPNALTDLNAALAKNHTDAYAYQLRSKINAKFGKAKEAAADRQECKKWVKAYKPCMIQIQDKIRASWHPPLIKGTGIAIAKMKVKVDGTVTSAEINKPSGRKDFDQSCLDAITVASPLTVLPANDIPDATVLFTFKFKCSLAGNSSKPSKLELIILNRYQQGSKLASLKTQLYKKEPAPTSQESAQTMLEMADIFAELKQYADAEKYYQQALEIHKRNASADNATTTDIAVKLADCYQSQKVYDKAEPLYKDAIANLEKLQPAKNSDLAHALQGYGKLMHKTKRRAEGSAMHKEAEKLKMQ